MSTKRPIINLYLTPGLKEEMDKRPDVNWSEVARKAFSDVIARDTQSEFGPYIAANIKKKNGKLKK